MIGSPSPPTEASARPRVVLAVTGSIAAYKACEVLRRLQDHGVDVRVAMTRNAGEFVSPTTFAALSGHRVVAGSFSDPRPERIAHVRWAEECDLLCVAPATADFLAKMALGIADDFPSTVHLAVDAPVIVAPAMEDRMWAHPAVRANVERLVGRGVEIVQPGEGYLASGRRGPGRLAEPERIVDVVLTRLGPTDRVLAGDKVVVTAGPTREYLDPVRVLTNPSSGRMGYALAAEARRLGGEVVLISGPTALEPPAGVEVVPVETGDEMREAALRAAADAAVVVMAAAVTDFRPVSRAEQKVPKDDPAALRVEFERTADILAEIAGLPGDRLVVGFAAETERLEERAARKLERKRCDLIVANRVDGPRGGFESEENEVVIIDRTGARIVAGPAPKSEIAATIWRAVAELRERADQPTPSVT